MNQYFQIENIDIFNRKKYDLNQPSRQFTLWFTFAPRKDSEVAILKKKTYQYLQSNFYTNSYLYIVK